MVNTRGSNVLDIFITDRPSLVESCDIMDGISDYAKLWPCGVVCAPSGYLLVAFSTLNRA